MYRLRYFFANAKVIQKPSTWLSISIRKSECGVHFRFCLQDHPKFVEVAGSKPLLYSRELQMGEEKKAHPMSLGEAVQKGIIANETLGYFIGRTYLFLQKIGIDTQRLRFRQHLANEMAHYAEDCWDAEIECSYGWIECVGLADRSAFDLTVSKKLINMRSCKAKVC